MSGTEDLLPSASDLDLNIDEEVPPKEEQKQAPTPSTTKEPETAPEPPKEEQKPEPLSEAKLMRNRIDELTNALNEEKKKNQLLNQQILLTKQQAMNQQIQERMKAKIPEKRTAKTFINDHKQVLIIVVILLVVSLVAAMLVNKTAFLKKIASKDENDDGDDEKD